jgi:hypothetical protein
LGCRSSESSGTASSSVELPARTAKMNTETRVSLRSESSTLPHQACRTRMRFLPRPVPSRNHRNQLRPQRYDLSGTLPSSHVFVLTCVSAHLR